jgi:hypothetical protein
MLSTSTTVFADTMAVQAVSSISTETPNKIIKVRVIRNCTLENIPLKIGYVIEGKMLTVKDPKRLKQNAGFTFYPMNYTDNNGKKIHIPKLYIGTFSPKFEINPAELTKTAVLTVGSHFVKGLSTGFYAVQGAIKNDEGNPLSSAVQNVYENSIFSYIEKGEQLNIPPSTCFGLKFDDCKNEPKTINKDGVEE